MAADVRIWTFFLLLCLRWTVASGVCEDSRWQALKDALMDAESNAAAYGGGFSPHVAGISSAPEFEWYKTNYQDCVEGLMSFCLYLSLHDLPRHQILVDLADRAARELNPLALRKGRSTWPLFGLLGELHLIWQAGDRVPALAPEPWRLPPCPERPPGIVSPLLTTFSTDKGQGKLSSLQLAYGMRPGSLLIDAGVFDGTDWTLAGVAAGATVLGFEPVGKNRRLFQERFPPAVAKELPEIDANHCHFHTILPVAPGEAMPQHKWNDFYPAQNACGAGQAPSGPGHAYIFEAGLGEQVKSLNMTTRYDYSSFSDQGYLKGPKDLDVERVAMTTLDRIFMEYLAPSGLAPGAYIDVLKVDVEGYELGVLRGAEQLLSEGRVRIIMMEFHPGMLGTSGTDPQGLLEFLQHYCFLCHSFKIDRPLNFESFVGRYYESAKMLPLQGLGELEDIVCENLWWRPPPDLAAYQPAETDQRAQAYEAATGF